MEVQALQRALQDAHAERDIVKSEFKALQVAYDRLMNELMDAKLAVATQNIGQAAARQGEEASNTMADEVKAKVQQLQRTHAEDRWKERCLKTEKELHNQRQIMNGGTFRLAAPDLLPTLTPLCERKLGTPRENPTEPPNRAAI